MKKIIAREGLVLLVVVLLTTFIILSKPSEERPKFKLTSDVIVIESALEKHTKIFNGGIIVVDLWLLYLATRFSLWGIQVLREK